MDKARQKEIAAKGGRSAHAKGSAHKWTPEEASKAGRRGGLAVSQNKDHMAKIGKKGGDARAKGWGLRDGSKQT